MTKTSEKIDPRLSIGANEPPKDEKMSITDIVSQQPAIVLTDEEKRAQLYEHIEKEIAAFDPDVSTVKGREAIKSFAFRYTKMKTAIDNAGKAMNEAARAQINIIDAARRDARNTLEILTDKARAPLTAWEDAEETRNRIADQMIACLRDLANVGPLDTSSDIRDRGTEAFQTVLSPDELGDRLDDVRRAKDEAVASLQTSLARVMREESDRAELERLRAEAAERDAREQAEREAREAKEREAAEAKAAEDRRKAAEKAEADRLEKARQEAAQRARDEADRAKQAEIDAANERARIAEEESRRQREEAERAARMRKEAEELAAAEQAKREANRAHRSRLMSEAKGALITCGADEETAKKIVLAIVAGEVPHVTLRF